jgi:hypothetical protein
LARNECSVQRQYLTNVELPPPFNPLLVVDNPVMNIGGLTDVQEPLK